MTQTQAQRPSRPPLALRIGITGARKLREDQLIRIHRQMNEALGMAKQEMERLSEDAKAVGDYYAPASSEIPQLTFRMISPLARGADRIAAQTALDLGYQLYVPMPFAQEEYEKDFIGSDAKHLEEAPLSAEEDLAEFRGLLAKAATQVALDGGRHASYALADDSLSAYSYEAVGRFVVRHCDLLIAVWDGKPSSGRGGTGEIVYHAATAGTPIWWIHASEGIAPAWIADVQDLRDGPAPGNDQPQAKLQNYLNRIISAPPKVHRHSHGWIGLLVARLRKGNLSPASVYFAEQPPSKKLLWKLFSRTFSRVMVLASGENPSYAPPGPPEDPVARYWFDLYQPADAQAGEYAARYRSGYVWVIVLATLALVLGALALGLALLAHGEHRVFALAGFTAALFELLTLLFIVVLVVAALRSEWQERSIEYRLLAELFRKQQALAPLGWTLSIGNVRQLNDSEREDAKQLSWVAWLFAAAQRSAPLPASGQSGAERSKSCRSVLQDLIDEQLKYHRVRERTSLNASATFEKWGGRMFILVLLCVTLKVLAELRELAERISTAPKTNAHETLFWIVAIVSLGLMAAVLPGISAAFVAIRSYAELEMLAEQSRHMIAELERARARVARLNLQRPLVSQDLGAEAEAVATVMLQDLEGWGRLFRGKAMEAS